jgi:hypothetical protein
MKKPTQHTRWHCFETATNKKIIRRFSVDETQPTQHSNECSPWIRGTGPHTPEALAKVRAINAEHFKGVPKPANQREKMSQAKLGRKFTKEHRAKLTEAWKGKREFKRLRLIEAYKLAESMAKELKAVDE